MPPFDASDSTGRFVTSSGFPSSEMLRRHIVMEARTMLATPFRHQGRHPDHGLDCVGLVTVVGHNLKLFHYDSKNYGHFPCGIELEAHALKAGFVKIRKNEAKLADIAVMRFNGEARHVAILTDRGIIHAYAATRRVVEHKLDRLWADRIAQFWRYAEVAFLEELEK